MLCYRMHMSWLEGRALALDAKELISLSIASTTAAAANTTAAATVAINDVTALPSHRR